MDHEDSRRAPIDWKARYHNLLDSLNIGFSVCDLNFVIKGVNNCYLRMIGRTREQIIGHHIRELYLPEDYEKIREIIVSHRNKDQYQYEYIFPGPNGERNPVLYSSHINRNADGEADSVNVLVTDIRELKKIQNQLESAVQALLISRESLENEKKMLETILFAIGDCVTIFDHSGKFMLGNPQGIKIRGERRVPLMPLEPGTRQEIKLQVGSERRDFVGKIEVIQDEAGKVSSFVEILKDVTSLVKLKQREQELSQIKRVIKRKELESEMIGQSRAMQTVFDLIIRYAEVDFDTLILGETGVGKEMAARAIHAKSARKTKPFIAVNCGALPEALFESELFGNVKGAYTGAVAERPGLFREAQGGVIFLDEFGDISKLSQVKLLRVLQEKEVRPVGSSKSFPVDVRVITATNKALKRLVDEGQFRSDLYYRISAIPLYIPPLRERKEDIIPLAEYFMRKHQNFRKKDLIVLDHQAQQRLLEYHWPGNIRELENTIKHALAMTRGPVISRQELPIQILMESDSPEDRVAPGRSIPVPEIKSGKTQEKPADTLRNLSKQYLEAEKKSILEALSRHNGSKTLAAHKLGISRTTLWRKITMHGLDG